MSRRRYGNRPGLLMALAILAFAGVLLVVYPDGWEHRFVLVFGAPIALLILWRWREYYRALRKS